MKTRIVYPQLWLDEKFAKCAATTKLLFCYLINNPHLKLTPYLHITDRQIIFDTGLSTEQLRRGKNELSSLRWVYFADNWVFHNHQCAYMDYDGRDRVLLSKERELASISDNIKALFKGLVTGYEPVLNHKSEIINNKLKIINNNFEGVETFTEKDSVKNDYSRLDDLTEKDFEEIAEKYLVPFAFVKSKFEDMGNWANQPRNKQKIKGRNWKLTLMSWVKDAAIKIRKEEHGKSKIAIIPD